jgi:pyruvate formate lyase activating enzyme
MGDRDVELRVMNVERFATHDGPGIRTVVFLKGCHLRCPWCANPESQSLLPVIGHMVSKCIACMSCAAACPTKAITFVASDSSGFRFDAMRCTECHLCERACLHEAVELMGEIRTVGKLVDLALRDADYYDESGGGLTVSGGEPLLNPAGTMALLREAHEAGIDTALESCYDVPLERVIAVGPYVDHFLGDLKHIDDELMHEVTGGNNRRVKEAIRWLAANCPDKVNVHIPVIPGFNYDEKTLMSMIGWLHGIGILRVNLLPYHTLGIQKYEKVGRQYTYPRQSLCDEDLERYHQYALSLGMESKIGA